MVPTYNGRDSADVRHLMQGTNEFEKTATVRARQMNHGFVVLTPEGRMEGHQGDYLVSDFEMTHAWPVRRDVFEATYRRRNGT